MRRTETSRAADVSEASVGTQVEVKGTLRCENPLDSEMTEHKCAYYRSEVDRRYQEKAIRDLEGRVTNSPMQRVETVLSNWRFAPFVVEDDSGSVGVRPEGAHVDALEVLKRYERLGSEKDQGITCGRVSVGPMDPGRGRTIGYRCIESILPIDSPVYVLGVVQKDGEIGAPQEEQKEEGEERFLISYRSEEQFEEEVKARALLYSLAALLVFLLGVFFLWLGVSAFLDILT